MRPFATDVAWSVCLLDTTVSHIKTAEPIEMPFGLWTRVYSRNYVLDGGPDNPKGKGQFWALPPSKCIRL